MNLGYEKLQLHRLNVQTCSCGHQKSTIMVAIVKSTEYADSSGARPVEQGPPQGLIRKQTGLSTPEEPLLDEASEKVK